MSSLRGVGATRSAGEEMKKSSASGVGVEAYRGGIRKGELLLWLVEGGMHASEALYFIQLRRSLSPNLRARAGAPVNPLLAPAGAHASGASRAIWPRSSKS